MSVKNTTNGLSRRTRENAPLRPVDSQNPAEAIKSLRKFKKTKFDQTINVVAHLGIDPKQADQALRGAISFPHGTGKTARVVAFCASDKVAAAKAAGAVEAGGEDLVAKIEAGWMDFDVAVASPDMMRVIAKLGKVLGPKGLMPSPKAGTVGPDVTGAVKAYAAGKTEYRNDDFGNIHCIIGKMSFSDEHLTENLNFFIETIEKAKPSSSKGLYFKKVCISGAMTPSVQVSV
ncbi:MAG: 50S ribosomal protein L1 [Planctomycetota bacterium]|nr:50S ribosomal protein L1 [Planctomycetota bacterium]